MEVEQWDNYTTGQVYGWTVSEVDDDFPMDSCWNYFGDDGVKAAISDAKTSIDCMVENERKAKQNKIKTLIKNRVPLYKREAMLS